MQSTSALYKQILQDPQHYFERKLVINLSNAQQITVEESSILSMNGSYDVFPDGKPKAGFAISGELETVIKKPTSEIPRAAQVSPYVRAVGTVNNALERSEWLQKGVFFIDSRENSVSVKGEKTLSFHAFDAMLKFDVPYPSDNQNNYPMLDTQMVAFLAQTIGCSVDARNAAIMTRNYSYPLPIGYTAREVLGFIAGSYGGLFLMSETGALRLLKLCDLPKRMDLLAAPSGDVLLFGNTRILLFA